MNTFNIESIFNKMDELDSVNAKIQYLNTELDKLLESKRYLERKLLESSGNKITRLNYKINYLEGQHAEKTLKTKLFNIRELNNNQDLI